MDLKCKLLLYLDKRRFLDSIENHCGNFLLELHEKACKFPPFRYLLELDVMELLDVFPKLGEFLLKEPVKFRSMCSEILYACVLTMINDDHKVESEQVAVNLRLRCVPQLSHPNPRNYTGLIIFTGLLLSVSKPATYVHHTVWSCPEECDNSEVIIQYIPKHPPKCSVCKSVLFENSGVRRCGEYTTATFKLKNELLPKHFKIVDDLITKLKIGSLFNIHLVTAKKVAIVWSVEEIVPLSVPITTPVPRDIGELFQACKGLPYKFVYCLASSIGVNVCPLHCFMQLKICLLLSLTSVKANILTGSTIIHILAAGYDTEYVGRIMEAGVKLADRYIFLGNSNTSVDTALVGSAGGVCVLPLPIHSYNQKHISSIISSVEAGEVSKESSKVKLQSAVWAQGLDFKKMNLFNVARVFGVVCRGDIGEHTDEIVDFILQNAVNPTQTSKEEIQALKDVIKYIDLVAGLDVTLDRKTETILRNYFLAARKDRPRGVTVSSMGALVATCLTSARLCRRPIANADDAIFAIWLHVSGSPEPRFAPDEYLQTPADLKKLEKIMKSFTEWLEQFTGTYIS